MKTLILMSVLFTAASFRTYPVMEQKRETAETVATCTGSSYCKACKNCKYCGHCAKRGGTCDVCR